MRSESDSPLTRRVRERRSFQRFAIYINKKRGENGERGDRVVVFSVLFSFRKKLAVPVVATSIYILFRMRSDHRVRCLKNLPVFFFYFSFLYFFFVLVAWSLQKKNKSETKNKTIDANVSTNWIDWFLGSRGRGITMGFLMEVPWK